MIYRIFMVLAVSVFLSTPLQANEFKIGVINMQKALNETLEGKTALSQLEKRLSAENEKLKQKQDELAKLENEIKKQGFMYSETKRIEMEEKYVRLKRQIERFREDKREEFGRVQQKATAKIVVGIMKVLNEFAKSEGFDVILEISQQAPGSSGVVIYHDSRVNITDKIIELYNQRSNGKGN